MLYLKETNLEDAEKEWLFVKDMPEDEFGLCNAWPGISFEDFKATALKVLMDHAKGLSLREGLVPETYFFLWDDDEIVGQFRLRHHLNDTLRTGADHIGYFVRKDQRGRHYGTEGLKLLLEIARNIVPEDEFYLRVCKINPASLHVMLNNGGRIVAENEDRFFVRIKNPGKKRA